MLNPLSNPYAYLRWNGLQKQKNKTSWFGKKKKKKNYICTNREEKATGEKYTSLKSWSIKFKKSKRIILFNNGNIIVITRMYKKKKINNKYKRIASRGCWVGDGTFE